MKDASVITTNTIHPTSVSKEVICPDEDYCGYCKFFENEDAYGFGYCRKFDTADVQCSDEACKLFEEDLS